MYSEKIILSNLEEFEARNGWMPVYHTLAQVEGFKAYIDSLVSIESNSKSSYVSIKRAITDTQRQKIRRWMENEQVLCGLD